MQKNCCEIAKLRIVLVTKRLYSNQVTERCSKLFHNKLFAELSNLFKQVNKSNVVIPHLKLDLGVISLDDFETEFSKHLLDQLLFQLKKYDFIQLSESKIITDKQVLLGNIKVSKDLLIVKLIEEVYSNNKNNSYFGYTSNQLMEQLAYQPAKWRTLLAIACLQPESIDYLYNNLDAQVLVKLCRFLVPDEHSLLKQQKPQVLLLLSALLHLRSQTVQELPTPNKQQLIRVIQEPDLYLWLKSLFTQKTAIAIVFVPWLEWLQHQTNMISYLKKWLIAVPNYNKQQQISFLDTNKYVNLNIDEVLQDTQYTTNSLTLDSQLMGKQPTLSPENLAENNLAQNAGLLLLWPLLPSLFDKLGLLEKDNFKDIASAQTAICWLDDWIWQDNLQDYARCHFSQLLCGVNKLPNKQWFSLPDEKKLFMNEWVERLTDQIASLQRCKINDIRSFFLQRPAQLTTYDSCWQVDVQPHASDILIKNLPWPLNIAVLPWLNKPININWPY